MSEKIRLHPTDLRQLREMKETWNKIKNLPEAERLQILEEMTQRHALEKEQEGRPDKPLTNPSNPATKGAETQMLPTDENEYDQFFRTKN